jgi:DNA recombination protein RmuC
MSLDRQLILVGEMPVSVADVLVASSILAMLLLVSAVVFAWRAQRPRTAETAETLRRTVDLEYRLAELSGTLRSFAEQAQGAQLSMAGVIGEHLDQVSRRLGLSMADQADRTGQSLQQLHERLAVIDAAQQNIAALSTEMVSLKDILSNKQARGAYGQGRMETIIRDGLPASTYAFQATLSNGTRPDCLVRLPESDVRLVIDAKFPLEAFTALRQAAGEGPNRQAEQRVRADVLKHVKDIAEKYLIAGETHDTAIMFLPSESIHAELIEHFDDVIQKAHRAHIILASPNILMMLVQTLQAIFKDARMREQAGRIKREVGHLLDDVSRLKERLGDLQKHFGAAASDIDKLSVSADRITRRGHLIGELDLAEQAGDSNTSEPRLVQNG